MANGRDIDDATAMRFVAALGAAMASANYPVTMVRDTMINTSRVYELDNQYLALPNYVQVGTSSGGGRLFISHPEQDLRFDQTFPLATLISRAQAGALTPEEGLAELDRIWRMPNRFPAWIGVIGYTVQSAGHAAGFGGGFTLTLCALAVSRRPGTPPTISLILPGFWLLVPGSLGLMGVTQLLGADSTTVFTATFISMISIALGVQSGLLTWRAVSQLGSSSTDPRAPRA